MKQEDIATLSNDLWEQIESNPEVRKEIFSLGIYNLNDFMSRYIKHDLDLANSPFLHSFLITNGEKIASIKEAHMPPESLSIQISYNGKNILGWLLLPRPGTAQYVYQAVDQVTNSLFLHDFQPHLYVAAIDTSNEGNAKAKKYLLNLCSISSWSQIYSRFSLAAQFVGEDLVNKALVAADCLNLEEMKEMAEADEFNEQDQ